MFGRLNQDDNWFLSKIDFEIGHECIRFYQDLH